MVSHRMIVVAVALSTCAAALGSAADLPDWKRACAPAGDAWRRTPQHFVYNGGSEPETLDPHVMTGSPELRLALALFEGLCTTDPRTLQPRPGVAESWDISPDGLTYVFHLRPNARWSDGRPLVAQDFLASWRRALTPATGGSYAGLFFVIEGAEDVFRRGAQGPAGVTAPDATTLRVVLRAPCSYFLELTAFAPFYPVRVDRIAEDGERWTRPGRLIGNGPFCLSEWEPRRNIVMVRNTNHWDAGFIKLDRITALPVDDLNTAYQISLKGGVHWLAAIPLARVEEIKRHPDYYVTPFFGTYFYRFNTTAPPFDDPRVRRALCLATDRREVTEHVLKSGQAPVGTFCPPVAGYEPRGGLPYDPAQARTLLAAAGYGAGGRALPPVEVMYNTGESHKLVAEAVTEQWRRNLGIVASARNVEWKVFLGDTKELRYQVSRASWVGDYGDPSTFFGIFRGGDGNNRTGWSNARYDALAATADAEPDPARRRDAFHEMERILVEEDCPILPLYRYVNQGMLAESVRGWYENIRDVHDFRYIWMEAD